MKMIVLNWQKWLTTERSPGLVVPGVLLLGGLGLIDAMVHPTVNLAVFYVVPVGLLTLRHSRLAGMVAGIAAAGFITLTGPALVIDRYETAVFNFFVRVASYSLIVVLAAYIRNLYLRNQELATDREGLLRSELLEKRQIIDEIHHRIKNQLSSLQLYLYNKQDDEDPARALDDAITRIGVISLLYDHLTYISKNQNGIPLRSFVQRLVELVAQTEALQANQLYLDTDGTVDEHLLVADEAHQVGLLLHELVTNSIKHVVKVRPDGLVRVHLRSIPQGVCMSVHDNGPGYDFEATGKVTATGGMGMAIAKGVAKQLGSPLLYSGDEGAMVRFCLPAPGQVLPDPGTLLPDPQPPVLPAVRVAALV